MDLESWRGFSPAMLDRLAAGATVNTSADLTDSIKLWRWVQAFD
jgi:hypothetical protein